METLPGIWSLTPLGGLVGVLIMLTIALVKGWLIPKSSHEREMNMANKRGDEWKETALESRQANQLLREQNNKLIEAVGTSTAFFASVTPKVIPEDTEVPDVSL